MPTPEAHRLHLPNRSPSTVTQHGENILRTEQTFDQLPFYPDYIYQRFISDSTTQLYSVGHKLMSAFWTGEFTKIHDHTDMVMDFTATATSAGAAGTLVSFSFRLYSDKGDVVDPRQRIGLLWIDAAGTHFSSTTFSRLKRIPAGRYKIRLAWGINSNSGGRQAIVDTGCNLMYKLRETALGLDFPSTGDPGMWNGVVPCTPIVP